MSPSGKSILLVDDDQEIRELLLPESRRYPGALRGRCCRLSPGLCAESADLVVLDVMLPDD
jgi:two-component system OmpR family response regulator